MITKCCRISVNYITEIKSRNQFRSCSRKAKVFLFALIGGNILLAQHDPIQPFQGKIGKTLKDTEQWWPKKVVAKKGSPNVIWILIDDIGFGASSAFGGLIETPTFDYLANNGLRYTNHHNTGICAPTRAALLTGRNHHMVGMGHHPELAVGTPGYNGDMPFEAGTIAEIMRENGYNTFAVGKWHLVRPEETSPAGPFNRWPTGRGFDHFYGFLGGSTDQWHPELVEENNQINIEPNSKHLNELITDKAIRYITDQKSADPDKPFFLYYSPGATHTPHQVAKEWIEMYKGKFDKGWDFYREEVFRRQQKIGLIPSGTKLPPRQEGLRAWKSLSSDEQKMFSHFMEVYSGFLTYTDHEIGRLVTQLKDMGQLNNTAIFLMIGDNGASKEGTYDGLALRQGGVKRDSKRGGRLKFQLNEYEDLGNEFTTPNYPLAWAQATNVPFRYWKSDAFAEGGTHSPLVVFYPNGIKEPGGIRTQYNHVIDMLPTTVELADLKISKTINGYEQMPIQGISIFPTLNDANFPESHHVQYYELHGGRAIYENGWKAAAIHPKTYRPRNPTGPDTRDINFRAPEDYNKDKWELYDLSTDWTETTDLSSKYPEKLKELQELFDKEAVRNNVYPLKDFHKGMPKTEISPQTILYGNSGSLFYIPIGKGPVTIVSEIKINDLDNEGVIFSNGDRFGGSVLYVKNNSPYYVINKGGKEIMLESDKSLSLGNHSIKVEFLEDRINLIIDEINVKSQHLDSPVSYIKNISNGISVHRSMGSPVSPSYVSPFNFTGEIRTITIMQGVDISLNSNR